MMLRWRGYDLIKIVEWFPVGLGRSKNFLHEQIELSAINYEDRQVLGIDDFVSKSRARSKKRWTKRAICATQKIFAWLLSAS